MLDDDGASARAMPSCSSAPAWRRFVDRQAGKLSGGMKQKLAVTCALLPEPRILVLDEPTAGVDVMARDQIWEILAERKHDVLIVISTSYLEEVAALRPAGLPRRGPRRRRGAPRSSAPRCRSSSTARGATIRAPSRARCARCPTSTARARPAASRASRSGATASPGPARVLRDLAALREQGVRLAEQAPLDIESMLLALSRGGFAGAERRA